MNWGLNTAKICFALSLGFFGIAQDTMAALSITASNTSVYYYEPGQATINGFATDTTGTITKLELYQDGALIASQTGSGRSIKKVVSNLPAGFYTFWAVAYNNENLTATSNQVKFRINPPIACTIENGSGQKQPDGSCKVVSCNVNYHIDGNACVANTQSCTIENGSGEQTWNGSDWGVCQVVSCNTNFHNENNSCLSDTRACTIDNGFGEQTWNGSGYNACQVVGCNAGFHQESNSCVSNVRSCTVPNGTGEQTWNGVYFGACQATACDAGYRLKDNACVAKMIVPGAGDITSVPLPTSVAGITVWNEQGGGTGTTYYVSPSGSDANDGLSPATPWQTLTKVSATTFQAGDSVLLEGGQNFTGCLSFTNAKIKSTKAQPFTLGSYGTGRFTLTAGCVGTKIGAIKIAGINGFILRDAIIRGNNGGAWYGVWITNPTSTVTEGVAVRNTDISGFYASGTEFGAEIFITGYPGAGLNHVNVINNVLHGESPSSLDDNGVSGFGNGKNIKNILYQGNRIYNIGGRANGGGGVLGNGILANGVAGGVIQHNIGHDLGGNVNTCGGNGAFWAVSSTRVTIQHNEAFRIRPITFTKGCDWNGFDLDIDVTDSVIQYNYSHDNYGAGYLIYASGTWGNNVIRYNISVNDALIGTSFWGGISTNNNSSTGRVDIYNNTVYNTGIGARGNQGVPIAINSATMNGVVANNIFYSSVNFGGKGWVFNTNNHKLLNMQVLNNNFYSPLPIMMEWGGVRYYSLATWQAASGQDPMALSVNPQFTTSTLGTTYQLSPTSPLLGVGVDFTRAPYNFNVGLEDYFGNYIPHPLGTGFNVGADGGNGQ